MSGVIPDVSPAFDAASTGVIETPKGEITPRMIGMVTEEIYNRETSGIVENPFFIHENVIDGVLEELRKEGLANPEELAPFIQEAIDAIEEEPNPLCCITCDAPLAAPEAHAGNGLPSSIVLYSSDN